MTELFFFTSLTSTLVRYIARCLATSLYGNRNMTKSKIAIILAGANPL